MNEGMLLYWVVIGWISLWAVAVALGAITKRLDDAVRMHILHVDANTLHHAARQRAMGDDGWDVDVVDDGADVDILADEPVRRAA